MKTKAIVFTASEKAELIDVELPPIQAGEILLWSTVSGVSVGTERWALMGRRPEMKFPFITGYLGVGVVEQAGDGASGFQVGDRVFTTAARHQEPYRSNSWLGTHCERLIVPTACGLEWPPYVCKIPDAVDDASAAMAGLAAVSIQGADMLKVTARDTALVLGLGMIGQSSVQVLRAKGARVIGADISQMRVDAARRAGCDGVVRLSADTPIKNQLTDLVPATGADIVVDTTAAPSVLLQLADLVKVRGQILFQGYYPGTTALNLDALHGRRPTIHVACAFDLESHRQAHRLIGSGGMKLGPLITHQPSVKDVSKIYEMLLHNSDEFLGIVFHWN